MWLAKPSGTYACVMCEAIDRGVASGSNPFLARVENIAIRGYPFHVLSAKSLTPLEHSAVHLLALIAAKITDVENNTFSAFPSLRKLSLDSNRLTNVKQTWFTGLEKVMALILSNNHIKQIDPGSFKHLTRLHVLDLGNNLLQVVDPAWLFGLRDYTRINLGLNEIKSISPGSFRHLQLLWLDLSGNDLSCLDGEVFGGQTTLSRLHVSSGMLSSLHDVKPHEIMWSLDRFVDMITKSATLVIEVPRVVFCTRHSAYELLFGWMFDPSNNVTDNIELGVSSPGKSCGDLDSSLNTISIQAPVVVLATNGSMTDKLVPDTLEQCMQVWEYNRGITVPVGLVGSPIFRLVSMAPGNTTFEGVAMSFVQTQDTDALTTTGCSQNRTTHTNTIHDNTKNITCILLTKDEHMQLFFTVPKIQSRTHTTDTYRTDTDQSSSLTHSSTYAEQGYTYTEPVDNPTLQVGTTPGPQVPPRTDHVLISVVVSAVVSLVALAIVAVLVWKFCSARANTEDERTSDDAHIWTIPPEVAFPGLLRSTSLPGRSSKVASDDAASCRSLPAVLHSIQPTYSEIPDDMAAAHRPLPSLPHTYSEVPDDAISGVVRSASLPAVTCRRGGAADDVASCRSLPAVVLSIEPTYSEIPDHIAIAQRTLPALPRTHGIPYHGAAAQRPLPAQPHTYSEIPDDESGPLPFYADAAELMLHVVTNRARGENRRDLREDTPSSSRHRSGRSIATYGLAEQINAQRNNFYRKAPKVQGIRSRRQMRTALVSQPADQVLTRVTQRRASLPLVTLPNTYWPWEIPIEGTRNTPRRASLSTLPNTYWPWEIPIEGTRDTTRRASLSTLPNTYWPWEIPGEGTCNTPRRASLPSVTLPNTYWPWEIPGEGTGNIPRRASLSTLPNTYWPWEIPGEGTCNTPRRASLPNVTLPNTYWPWEIQGEGTGNTSRRASLSTLPNTYWPWEIPIEGTLTGNTPRRAPLTLTLPNTYWPWEIPSARTGNTPRRAPLTRTLPNTYWPWEIPMEGTGDTPRRASLSTLPNTYWPWEIPGERAGNTQRRAPLPLTLPNTYWPWEIPIEGTRNTPRPAPLPLTLPNTYWPWEIPGEGTRNTP
ncbi:LRIG2 [Branchiostoma lanceolatum]|uniref:LRIG2 protein n=1 Tax=Branchiostoma lanceolatum TaxID=7740 RepID=A0A8J9Z0B3_BRALA|nr:LRIG2 [Branchiostoma lanceolatum]